MATLMQSASSVAEDVRKILSGTSPLSNSAEVYPPPNRSHCAPSTPTPIPCDVARMPHAFPGNAMACMRAQSDGSLAPCTAGHPASPSLILLATHVRQVEEALSNSRANLYAKDEDIKHCQAEIVYNASTPVLVEAALQREKGSFLTDTGALSVRSGAKTGRSPKDKRVVEEANSVDKVWWGPVNIKMSLQAFMINRERAIDYINTRDRIYVIDGYAGWDPKYRVAVRVICCRAYHALFMKNMLVDLQEGEAATFTPQLVIFNAGGCALRRRAPSHSPHRLHQSAVPQPMAVAMPPPRCERVVHLTPHAIRRCARSPRQPLCGWHDVFVLCRPTPWALLEALWVYMVGNGHPRHSGRLPLLKSPTRRDAHNDGARSGVGACRVGAPDVAARGFGTCGTAALRLIRSCARCGSMLAR